MQSAPGLSVYVPKSAAIFLRFFGKRSRTFWIVAYVVASIAGAVLAKYSDLPSGYSPWFPPAGFALGCLILGGWRYAPLVLATRFADTAATYPDILRHDLSFAIRESVLIIAVYTLGAEVLRRFALRRAEMREFGWLVAVGVILTPLIASAGIVAIVVSDGSTFHDAVDRVRPFWVGDAVSIAAIVPLMMVGKHLLQHGSFADVSGSPGSRRVALLQALSLFVAPMIAVRIDDDSSSLLLIGAVLPALWVSGRRDPFTATLGIFVVNNMVALVATAALQPTATLVELQAVMLVASVAALYVIAITRTQTRWAALLLRRQQEIADEERLQSLAMMAGGVAHDLRGLIGVIVGNAYVVEKAMAPDSVERSFLRRIDVAARSAERITQRLLTFAKNRPTEKQVIDVSSFVIDVQPLLQGITRNHELSVQLATSAAPVFIDPAEFEQVLINLVANATQASPSHTTVSVSVDVVSAIDISGEKESDRADRWVVVAVADHGSGIAPDVMSSMFDPFFTTKQDLGGTGLGLSTVRTIVNGCRGFVRAESRVGEGATFRVYLPISDSTSTVADRELAPVVPAQN